MMDYRQLIHLVHVAKALAPDRRIVVFGSMCVVVKHPTIADETPLYRNTLDADFIPEPWSEQLGQFMNETMGKESPFRTYNGYYADIVRPDAYDQFPPGFQERLVPISGFENAFALEIHDMAVAKLWAGRPKDIALLSALLHLEKLDEAVLRKRLWDTPMVEKWIVKTHDVLERSVAEAKRLTESGIGAQDLQILP
jgi:hypothetical protein